MNITLSFLLPTPKYSVDPTTGEVKVIRFENVPATKAAGRIDEATALRVSVDPSEKEAALDIVARFQKKYPAFAKVTTSNKYGLLYTVSRGQADNKEEAVDALGI